MPRFVILRHDMPSGGSRGLHWDLMLEERQALRTWALAAAPRHNVEVSAEQLPHHRISYLEFEGPVSGGRGSVARWDWGEYELCEEGPASLRIELRGQRLRCALTLDYEAGHRWTARFGAP
jgi:hypothetical protein